MSVGTTRALRNASVLLYCASAPQEMFFGVVALGFGLYSALTFASRATSPGPGLSQPTPSGPMLAIR